jgi:hypothetical protein
LTAKAESFTGCFTTYAVKWLIIAGHDNLAARRCAMNQTIEDKLLHPRPGSKAAAAQEFGIDLTLLVENLRLTPQQRLEGLQISMRSLEEFSRQAELWRKTR